MALLGSVGAWLLQTSLAAPPIYLINLPLCLGIPLFLLGAPILLVSAPEPYVRVYSWGAIGLGFLLAATWCLTAFIDPHATHPFTQTGLLFGWMAGGTIYEVLLIVLVASS